MTVGRGARHRSGVAVAAVHRLEGEKRLLTNGAVAHEFTAEERRRGAQRTNEIKRERAARRRAATGQRRARRAARRKAR